MPFGYLEAPLFFSRFLNVIFRGPPRYYLLIASVALK